MRTPEPLITVTNLSKKFRLGYHLPHFTLRETIQSWFGQKPPTTAKQPSAQQHLWALKDVSFHVDRAEILGIAGANGAGKSTILRLIAQIICPTKGTIKLNGRVHSLIGIGTGFHPELTGRANIFFNGILLGMNRQEVNHKFDKIVAFSEINACLDTPVKHYSSGMRLKLAFAVAAHLQSDILIVDEALSFSDAAFRQKAIDSLQQVRKNGGTVLFVSHDMHLFNQVCTRAIHLHQGQLIDQGSPARIMNNLNGSLYRTQTKPKSNLGDEQNPCTV